VKISEVMGLTPRLAKDYAGKTDRTLSRDLNALVEMGLVKKHPRHLVSARSEIILAFLPWMAGDRTENNRGDQKAAP
jgi:hypothetical protein